MAKLVTKDTLTSVVNTVSNSYIKNIDVTSRIMTPAEIIGVCEIIDPYYQLKKPLTFTIINGGGIVLTNGPSVDVYYKKNDDVNWTTIVSGTINVSAGDVLYLAANNYCSTSSSSLIITTDNGCTFKASGNIMSLIDKDNFANLDTVNSYQFYRLFYQCYGLIDASALLFPATHLSNLCYYRVFRQCTGLIAAPTILPATTLSTECYKAMFNGCTALIYAPELPSLTLADSCYSNMFSNCASLQNAPILRAPTLVRQCYYWMFGTSNGTVGVNNIEIHATDISASEALGSWLTNASSTGTFKKKSGVTYPSGTSGIPTNWTVIEME